MNQQILRQELPPLRHTLHAQFRVNPSTLRAACWPHFRIPHAEKTGQPSTAAQRLLSAKLPSGDFYPWVEKADKWEQQVGPIKAFAWPLLLQAGGLANRTGTRLSLSPADVKALSAAPAEVIRSLWRKWLKTSLLDVAYFDPTDPEGGVDDFRSLWGTDDLTFLSRYDGLSHFRINALGAFVLGLADTYQPAAPVSAVALKIMPSLLIGVTSGALLMLDTWAQALPDGLWRLDRAKALEALEKGHDISTLQQFLDSHASRQPGAVCC